MIGEGCGILVTDHAEQRFRERAPDRLRQCASPRGRVRDLIRRAVLTRCPHDDPDVQRWVHHAAGLAFITRQDVGGKLCVLTVLPYPPDQDYD